MKDIPRIRMTTYTTPFTSSPACGRANQSSGESTLPAKEDPGEIIEPQLVLVVDCSEGV